MSQYNLFWELAKSKKSDYSETKDALNNMAYYGTYIHICEEMLFKVKQYMPENDMERREEHEKL